MRKRGERGGKIRQPTNVKRRERRGEGKGRKGWREELDKSPSAEGTTD
jgi:hypothetical protein